MIKCVLFDLDGVLLESCDMHWSALNNALRVISPKHVISYDEHLKTFNGIPTKTKLNILTEKNGLAVSCHAEIQRLKQIETIKWISSNVFSDKKVHNMLSWLKCQGISVGLASNSTRATVDAYVAAVDLSFDVVVSNSDVINPKPAPDVYLKCLQTLGFNSKEALAIEDSAVGARSALAAGVYLLQVSSPKDLTLHRLKDIVGDRR